MKTRETCFRSSRAGLSVALVALLLAAVPFRSIAGPVTSAQFRQGGAFSQKGTGEFHRLPNGKAAWRGKGGDDDLQRSFLEYNLGGGGFPSVRGTVAFELTRGEAFHRETVFSLADNTYQRLFAMRIYWEKLDAGTPSIYFYQPNRTSAPYWYVTDPKNDSQPKMAIPIGREVPPGGRVRIVLTWDESQGGQIFVDGVSLGVKANPAALISPLAAGATKVIIGAETDARIPNGAWSMMRSSISDFRVFDAYYPDGNVPEALSAPSLIRQVSDDSFRVPGVSGKLVAGDKVTVTLLAVPGGKASFDMGDVKGIPMVEVPPSAGGAGISAVDNGTYRGVHTIPPGEYCENGQIVGRFVSADNVVADNVVSESRWTIDSRARFGMSIDKTDLPADSSATARVKVTVKDANDAPIRDHQIKVTLSTTDEYTGLVGGGSARYRGAAEAARELLAGAEVETRWKGVTDSWGEVEFDFTSGFAAKTIVLQAKDMTSGDVGVDYITSYKEASIDIALTAPRSLAAARRGLQYTIKVEATRTELTADGRSRSVIRATVQDPTGRAVPGDSVVFSLSSANGTLNTIRGTTDASGVATAEYIAGKKIGIVVVTATDTVRNISGSVSITLLADAPAKIILKARPETLPADGNSRADISVKVTDINDNPNKDTKVEFRLSRGSGRLDYVDRFTDRFGDSSNRFTAGTTPGIATIVATVRSKVPTEEELSKARNVLFVPYSEVGEDIRISRWLKKAGETALKGEGVVEYTFGRGETKYTLNAPYDCRIDFQFVEYWDDAKTGDTLARITPVAIPGTTTAPPALPVQAPRRR